MADKSVANAPVVLANDRTYRPEEIAIVLGLSGKLVRGYLRSTFTRPLEAKGTTWVLSNEQAQAAVDHFVSKRSPVVPNAAPDAS